MQATGQGPPTRTHGQPPIVELKTTGQYTRTPRATGYRPSTPPTPYYGPGPATGRPPQQPYQPSHLAVNAAYTKSNQQQQQQQQQPPHQQQRPTTTHRETRMVKFQETPRQQELGPIVTRSNGYNSRTVPVAQINARRTHDLQLNGNADLQPVDAMQAIMRVAKQYGGDATYPTAQEVSDFGRGGSFPRRF